MKRLFIHHKETADANGMDRPLQVRLPNIGRKPGRGRVSPEAVKPTRTRLSGRRTTTPGFPEDHISVQLKRQSPEPVSLNASLRGRHRDVCRSLDASGTPRTDVRSSVTDIDRLASLYLPKTRRYTPVPEPLKKKQQIAELQQVISSLQEKSKLLLAKLQVSIAKPHMY